jgi:hypothetical protein
MYLASLKSYIVQYDQGSGKWPLLIECSRDDHARNAQALWEFCKIAPVGTTKADLCSRRARLQSGLSIEEEKEEEEEDEGEEGEEEEEQEDEEEASEGEQNFFQALLAERDAHR